MTGWQIYRLETTWIWLVDRYIDLRQRASDIQKKKYFSYPRYAKIYYTLSGHDPRSQTVKTYGRKTKNFETNDKTLCHNSILLVLQLLLWFYLLRILWLVHLLIEYDFFNTRKWARRSKSKSLSDKEVI